MKPHLIIPLQVGKHISVLSIINIDSGIQAYFRVVMASQVMGASTSYFGIWLLKENTELQVIVGVVVL